MKEIGRYTLDERCERTCNHAQLGTCPGRFTRCGTGAVEFERTDAGQFPAWRDRPDQAGRGLLSCLIVKLGAITTTRYHTASESFS